MFECNDVKMAIIIEIVYDDLNQWI